MLKIIEAKDTDTLAKRLKDRGNVRFPTQERVVKKIVEAVEKQGDAAVFSYTKEFDHFDVNESNLVVSEEELKEAFTQVSPEIREILVEAAANIEAFHQHQKRDDWFIERPDGSFLGQRYLPVERAAVYVPGGTAAYPSSVLMNIIPAKVAGVPSICVATPAPGGKVEPVTVVAAHVAGAEKIFKIGGAQAIAAFAFGTEYIPRADVITGPGNVYVALAKKMLYGRVGLDMIAGPSEICIIADGNATVEFAAADLLSQAEHDPLAAAILLTDDAAFAGAVNDEVKRRLNKLPRKAIASKSIASYGTIVLCEDIRECVRIANEIAPEHLEILTADPEKLLFDIHNAGSIFLGEFSPEPLGDYFAGTNHILPTNGTARFSSPLNVDDFQRKSSVIYYTRSEMEASAAKIAAFARVEGLEGHAQSAELRMKGKDEDA